MFGKGHHHRQAAPARSFLLHLVEQKAVTAVHPVENANRSYGRLQCPQDVILFAMFGIFSYNEHNRLYYFSLRLLNAVLDEV